MRLLKSLLFVLAIGFTSNSSASVTTMGDRSCGEWVEHSGKKDMSNIGNGAWLTGMLSGMAITSGIDVLKEPDGQSIYLWMDNYCNSHPLDRVGTGAAVLFTELVQRMEKKK